MKWWFFLILLSSPVESDPIETTDDVIDIVSDCLEIGSFALDALEPLGAIAAVGHLVGGIVHLFHHTQDPTMKKLDDLDNKLTNLGVQMTQEFRNLEAFMIAEYRETSGMLYKFLQDTINDPGNDSINAFYAAYTRNPPMELTYRLIATLEEPITNPLKKAMDADPLKSASTFEAWRKIIDGTSSQLLFIETYANGMFNNQTMYGPNTLKDKLETLKTTMEGWKQQYKSSYWPNVVPNIVLEAQRTPKVSNWEVANIISYKLSKGLTDDAFIVMVYNNIDSAHKHAFSGYNNFKSFNINKRHVVVTKSTKWRAVSDAERLNTVNKVNEYSIGRERMHCSKLLVTEVDRLTSELIIPGTIGLIRDGNKLELRGVNNSNGTQLAGAYTLTQANCHKHDKFWLIAGYE